MNKMSANKDTTSVKERLRSSKRLVIKVGSALLFDDEGAVAHDWLDGLANDIVAFRANGAEVVIVSSGAVGLGRRVLDLGGKLKLEEKQAAAAAGQSLLMDAWRRSLEPKGITAAQVLLTLPDTENRRRYLNARSTLTTLLSLRAAPIVNENDTIATDEIRYGDNDRLAARIAQMVEADLLLILSDVDGLYTADPRQDPSASHIPVVNGIDSAIEALAGGPNAERALGSGGMKTKIDAAKIANGAGCAAVIAKGAENQPIAALNKDARSTLFVPSATPAKARQAWISGGLTTAGSLTIDEGACKALKGGASLLPAGITGVKGAFDKGDAVALYAPDGALVGRGLAAYESREVREIMGLRSDEAGAKLGYRRAAVIHRDDLALA